MFYNTEVAWKYKMSSMQAALGLAQLERIEELVVRKREIFEWYRDALGGIAGVQLNQEAPNTRNAYWMVTAILDPSLGLPKERLMEQFSAEGIDTRPFFHPLSSIPAYATGSESAKARQRNKVSHRISPCGINLPSGLNLQPEQVKRVAAAFQAILSRARSS